MDEKRSQVLAVIEARNKERQSKMDEVKDSLQQQSTGFFEKEFWTKHSSVKELLQRMQNKTGAATNTANIKENLDEVALKLRELQKFLSESAQYLPAYDARKAQDGLGELHGEFQLAQKQLEPAKKFTFKSRYDELHY